MEAKHTRGEYGKEPTRTRESARSRGKKRKKKIIKNILLRLCDIHRNKKHTPCCCCLAFCSAFGLDTKPRRSFSLLRLWSWNPLDENEIYQNEGEKEEEK